MPIFGMAVPHNPAQLQAAADFCRHNGLRFLALPAVRLAGLPKELEGVALLDAGQCVFLEESSHRAMETALLAGDLGKVAENICNVFDPVVTSDHLELNYIKSIFHTYGALAQQMTGSGSAVFAIMENFEYAAVACNMLKDNYPQVFIAKPV